MVNMIENRTFKIMFLLISGILAGGSIILIMPLDERSALLGIGVGVCVGLATCIVVEVSNIRLMGETTAEQEQQANRWLIFTAVGGVALARLVTNLLTQEMQYFINSFIFTWIAIFFTCAAYWAWRHK